MNTYITNNQVGALAPGTVFPETDFDKAQIERFLELGAISLHEGEAKPKEDDSEVEKLKANLAKAKKDLKDERDKEKEIDDLKKRVAASEGFVSRVKAHVESLPKDQAEAFRKAVNEE